MRYTPSRTCLSPSSSFGPMVPLAPRMGYVVMCLQSAVSPCAQTSSFRFWGSEGPGDAATTGSQCPGGQDAMATGGNAPPRERRSHTAGACQRPFRDAGAGAARPEDSCAGSESQARPFRCPPPVGGSRQTQGSWASRSPRKTHSRPGRTALRASGTCEKRSRRRVRIASLNKRAQGIQTSANEWRGLNRSRSWRRKAGPRAQERTGPYRTSARSRDAIR